MCQEEDLGVKPDNLAVTLPLLFLTLGFLPTLTQVWSPHTHGPLQGVTEMIYLLPDSGPTVNAKQTKRQAGL